MLISLQHKFIFIANPKTGTSAVQKFIMTNVQGVSMNILPKEIEGSREVTGLDEHIKTRDLKRIIAKDWHRFKVITFIRNPYSKAVSAYFFYKNGQPITNNHNKRYWLAKVNVILARLIPFTIWSLLVPIKTNKDYLYDEQGMLLVDLIGRTEYLEIDLKNILGALNIHLDKELILSSINSSTHKSPNSYYKLKLHDKLFRLKYRNDFEIYDKFSLNSIED